MPTSAQVAVFIDPTERMTITHYPARTIEGTNIPVPESVCVSHRTGTFHIDGTPAEAAAWFRAMADRLEYGEIREHISTAVAS